MLFCYRCGNPTYLNEHMICDKCVGELFPKCKGCVYSVQGAPNGNNKKCLKCVHKEIEQDLLKEKEESNGKSE